ncbi:hypothetical protein RSOL_154050, partial [Rhizoctonia solani AG-3 Rhs1AP]
MNPSNYAPFPAIQRWEEAGASLLSTLKHYKTLCLTLASESLLKDARPNDLVAKIISAFELHAAISQQLLESDSALQKVRNKLVSPFFRLPEEIILNIFTDFVYGPTDREAHIPPSVAHDVRLIYRRLYTLIGVCSGWKYIAVNGPKLWSVIPMIELTTQQQPFRVSLQRAGASKLYLTATNDLPTISDDLVDVLTKHHPYFYAINLSARDPDVVRDALDTLVRAGNPGSLAKLSIRAGQTYYMNSRLPKKPDYVIPHDHPQLYLLTNMLQGLTTFHTNGALIHWNTLAFSTRLVELCISDIMLGYDDKIIPFLQTLSSASELRDMNLISVQTFHIPTFTASMIKTSSQPVRFPNLQSLFLRDIHYNTLRFLLPLIAPGSHRLTLFLTPKCLRIKDLEDVDSDEDEVEDSVNVADLCKILESVPVDTLMITGYLHPGWLTSDMIYSLPEAMPTLKTFKIDSWMFDHNLWEKISRSPGAGEDRESLPFPMLENLYLTWQAAHFGESYSGDFLLA